MNEPDAVTAHAVSLANDVVQGRSAPYEGAKALWRLEIAVRQLHDALVVFTGLASEWEDHPERREEYEREIVVEADRFMARFGK
jgi:hypothetical protein